MTDETIFAAALEKAEAAERSAYLDAACGGDAARRRRIDGLLAALAKAGGFLDRPAVAAADPGPGETRELPADATDDPAGTRTHGAGHGGDAGEHDALAFLAPPRRPDSLGRIGHYEVLEVLGRGGFGIVFRAFDEVLQRVVAVKVLAPQMAATSPARKRFLREARSSAQVRHENVVQVHAVEEHPLPYLVMEFIPGETLQQRLDRTGPLDVPEILRFGRQTAEGLAAAHAQGLVHRDIKPANVLIEGGPGQRVKLTDFGLARAADDASISQSGVVAGTPMYMAPEQARGEALDHRADLFSLGSVLYVMCTGRPPFRASGTLAVLKRVCEEDPRPVREVIPEVPEWLCRVIEKLHAKDPADRFQTAREAADVLADCEAQVKAHGGLRDFGRIPGGKPRRRERWEWAAAALVLLLVVWGVYALTRPVSESDTANPVPPAVPGSDGPAVAGWGAAVDPDRDCTFDATADGLTITVPGGKHNLNPTPAFSNLSAPRVLRKAEGDFEIEARVASFRPPRTGAVGVQENYVGAGLLLWQDASNFVRFIRSGNGETGTANLHFEYFRDGRLTVSTVLDRGGLPTVLRAVRTGGRLRFFHGTDGTNWVEYPVEVPVGLADKLEVGVCAINTTRVPFAAGFSQFRFRPGTDGWVQLFNGKDLAGWKPSPHSPGDWRVEDGALVGRNGPGYLFSTKSYEDFHLRVEARVNAGGNSGVAFRRRFQAEILNDPLNPTGTLLEVGPKTTPLAHYPRAIPEEDWFTLEVRAEGRSLAVRVNDGPWVSGPDDRPAGARSGPFELEAADPETVVRFRKIEVKELPPGKTATPPPAVAPFDGDKAKGHQEAWAKHLGVPVEITNGIGMKLRLIPPGRGPAGSTPETIEKVTKATDGEDWAHGEIRGEGPARTVTIEGPYYVGVHEVTRGHFERFVAETGYVTEAEAGGEGGLAWDELAGRDVRKPEYTWKNAVYAPSRHHPVVFVTAADARAFCDWLGRKDGRSYALPSEAQWEFACRAGTTTHWYCGNEPERLDACEWIKTNSEDRSRAVGSKSPNPFGLYDMSGNVSEVVPDTAGKPVHRGGTTAFSAWLSRSASRYRIAEPSYSHARGGFRVAVVGDLKPKQPPAVPDPAAVQAARDLVAAKEGALEKTAARVEAGADGPVELWRARADLAEARARLAEVLGDKPAGVAALQELVKDREEERRLVAIRVEEGVERASARDAADGRVAEAKLRLATARAESPPAVAPAPRPVR